MRAWGIPRSEMTKPCAALVIYRRKLKLTGEKREETSVLLRIFPFLRLFSFCTQWIDLPFALLNSAIEILTLLTTNSEKYRGSVKQKLSIL